MRVTLLCLAVLFLVPHVDAAPAPAPGRAAKEKLEALKKRLLTILADRIKADRMKEKNQHFNWASTYWTYKPEVRLLRRVGPERVKAVIVLVATDAEGRRDSDKDVLLTIFLSYQDGYWTTEEFETNCLMFDMRPYRAAFAFLMLAIDEAAEKQGTK